MTNRSSKLTLMLITLILILVVALGAMAPGLAARVTETQPTAHWEMDNFVVDTCPGSGGGCGGGG